MQTVAETAVMLAIFNLGGGEIILILALVLILLGAKKLPEIGSGLGQGITWFRDATKRLKDGIDEEASDAGRSVGGIYGKPAAQALTPENQVAELYDPAVLQDKSQPPKPSGHAPRRLMRIWWWLGRVVRAIWRMDKGP